MKKHSYLTEVVQQIRRDALLKEMGDDEFDKYDLPDTDPRSAWYIEQGMDDMLRRDGWEETGGIALWTNPKHPNVWLDSNAGQIQIYPMRAKGPFNNSYDDFVGFARTYAELQEFLASEKGTKDYLGQEREWRERDAKWEAERAAREKTGRLE